jgi:glycosyltransferase involved in cell wall biosynthesis
MNGKTEEVILLVPRYHTNLEPIVQGFTEIGFRVHVYPRRSSIAEIRNADNKLNIEDRMITRVLNLGNRKVNFFRFINMWKTLNEFKANSDSMKIFVRCEASLFGFISLCLVFVSRTRKFTTVYTQYPIANPRVNQVIWIFIVKNVFKFKYFSQVFVKPDYSSRRFKEIDSYTNWMLSELSSNRAFIPFALPNICREERSKTWKMISVGKSEQRKGLMEIVEVCRKLWVDGELNYTLDLVLQVLNNDHKIFFCELFNSVSDLIEEGRIKIYTNLNALQTRIKISESDFLILNSINEPASFVQFEALALKVPFILNRSNGSSYLLPDGFGLKKIDTISSLREGILDMVENFDMYKKDIAKIQVLYSVDLNGASIATKWLNT